jgi:hypothetical protein
MNLGIKFPTYELLGTNSNHSRGEDAKCSLELGIVVHNCNPITQEAEVGGP